MLASVCCCPHNWYIRLTKPLIFTWTDKMITFFHYWLLTILWATVMTSNVVLLTHSSPPKIFSWLRYKTKKSSKSSHQRCWTKECCCFLLYEWFKCSAVKNVVVVESQIISQFLLEFKMHTTLKSNSQLIHTIKCMVVG